MTPSDRPGRLGGHGDAIESAPALERLAYRVDEAAHVSGISKSSLYEAMKEKRLVSRKVCGRRLILKEDLLAFLRQEAA